MTHTAKKNIQDQVKNITRPAREPFQMIFNEMDLIAYAAEPSKDKRWKA